MKCRSTGAEVQLPHPGKLFIEHLLYLIDMLPVILFPAAQGFIIMKAQIFHIQRVKIVLRQAVEHFPQAWYNTARKNVFFYPGISRIFFQSADKVEKEQAARL